MGLHLVIGNKNYSSWSLRPWIAMKAAGIPFEETVISLDAPDFKARVAKLSRHRQGAGADRWRCARLGIARDPGISRGEISGMRGLWPADASARAHARAVAAEMHAGFLPLRRHLPMNMWRPVKARDADARGCRQCHAHRRDLERLPDALRASGPFLFGGFGAADAMYAPVVSRFHTYAVDVGAVARAYMDAVMALPAWGEWRAAALREPGCLPHDEVDWPTVCATEYVAE